MMWVKQQKGWRMNCDVGEVTERLENEQSSFSNPAVALPTSQFILQPFRCFTHVTAHSPTLLLLLLHHRFFTWQATYGLAHLKMCNIVRKTWKGIKQTKMEGGQSKHLPKTAD